MGIVHNGRKRDAVRLFERCFFVSKTAFCQTPLHKKFAGQIIAQPRLQIEAGDSLMPLKADLKGLKNGVKFR